MHSLLERVTAADIRTDPFPHIIIPNALDPGLYGALADSFPSFSRIAWESTGLLPNNRRFALLAQAILDAPDLPDCWKEFTALHSGPEFLDAVATLFAGHWHPDLLAALDGQLTGHSSSRFNLQDGPDEGGRIRQDARIEINTPVRDRPSAARGPHLDTPNRLYSGLFYMRAPEDDSIGGELVLYRWREGAARTISAFQLPDAAVTEMARIPYRANQFVLFPQGIDALHGVGLRHPTPHIRRYVFITAELARDWLTLPARENAA